MEKLLLRPENYQGHHQKIIRKLFYGKIIWHVINKFRSFAANLYHVYLWKTASCKKNVKKIISTVSYPDFSWAYRYIYVMCAWVELKDHSWNPPPPCALIKGGGVGPSKNWVVWEGIQMFLLERRDKPVNWGLM